MINTYALYSSYIYKYIYAYFSFEWNFLVMTKSDVKYSWKLFYVNEPFQPSL